MEPSKPLLLQQPADCAPFLGEWANPLNSRVLRAKCRWQQQELGDVLATLLAPTVASLFSFVKTNPQGSQVITSTE